ncbi:5'/3'-nucleotidase SurE [Gammaproteobacteria bacterium AH-315-C21]|nr:5'/3'-nucleotidase SurE [Gammaproteobacteria bacterium AH-315-C21]
MRILLSNDDGYLAPGLLALYESLRKVAHVDVIAPDQNRSGASNSLTLLSPLRLKHHANGVISVDGTPTDCVHLAVTGLLEQEPDMVISGINAGANLGDDVIYSGTVAAAMEGRFLGLPAIAVSLAGRKLAHYDSAVKAIEVLVNKLQVTPLDKDTLLNVNVPDLPWHKIKGFISTRLGYRHKAEPVIKSQDPRGEPIYWVGAAGAAADAGEGTDFHAIDNGYISVTPIHVDLTRYQQVDTIGQWLPTIDTKNDAK